MEDNEKLSAERSLKIISQAIEQSRNDIMRNAGTPMIFWGLLTCATAAIVCLLWKYTGNPSWNALWFLMAVIGWCVMAAKSRKDKKKPTNFFSRVLRISWISFGLFALITAVIGTLSFDSTVYTVKLPITTVLILLLGLTGLITGLVLRHTFITTFSVVSVVPANFALIYPGPYESLAICLTSLFILVIPGIIINRQYKK